MERAESLRKVNIREELTELFSEFEESLQTELHEVGYTIVEEAENFYKDITLNKEALPQLLENIKSLLKDLPKQLLIHKEGLNVLESPQIRLKFNDFIETRHESIESAVITIASLGIFVAGDSKGLLSFWDIKTFETIAKHSFDYSIKQFAFDSQQGRLIIAFEDVSSTDHLKSYKISQNGLDISSDLSFDCQESVSNMLIIEQERKLIVEDIGWRIQVWNLDSHKHLYDLKIEGDQWFIRGGGLGNLSHSKLIIVPGADKQVSIATKGKKVQENGKSTLRLFSIENGELVKEVPVNFKTIIKIISEGDKLILVDVHGSLIFLNSKTLEEENRIDFEDYQILDAVYSKKMDLLVCTTECPIVVLVKFREQKILRKLHPKVSRCEKSALYLPGEEKVLVMFHVDESEFVSLGVLELKEALEFNF